MPYNLVETKAHSATNIELNLRICPLNVFLTLGRKIFKAVESRCFSNLVNKHRRIFHSSYN